MKKTLLFLFISLFLNQITFAFQPASSGEILLNLKKLHNMGSVLYIAAHPDDENTRLIAYLVNGEHIRTGYLSLTRGDGGQNLIGTEKGEYIGLLRTQELLEARKVDGGEQFFTRAVDFGYSKSSEETLEKWNKQQVLEDMVWAIRKFKPEILITRFPPNNYAGHGHHSASAILAEEAFEKAADPTFAPKQLQYYKPWQPKSLYFNTSTWWDKTIPEQAEGNEDFIRFDIGSYNPELGMWHNEIASLSRSKHKSQGFGTTLARGTQPEYLKYVKGEKRMGNLFTEQDLSWKGVNGGEEVEALIQNLIQNFNPQAPHQIVSKLIKVKRMIKALAFEQKQIKLNEVDQIIFQVLGLYAEAITDEEYISKDLPSTSVSARIINPSPIEVKLLNYKWSFEDRPAPIQETIANNKAWEKELTLTHSIDKTSQPYWLVEDFHNMFTVMQPLNIGKPENDPFVNISINFEIQGESFTIIQEVENKKRDRVKGELRVPLKNYPSVMVTPQVENLVFSAQEFKSINVVVKSLIINEKVLVKVKLPEGWEAKEEEQNVVFDKKGEEKTLVFEVKPTVASAQNLLSFSAKINERTYSRGLKTIEYDHITKQVLFPKTQVKLIKVDLAHKLNKIAYLMGAGDEVPVLLQNLGIEVVELLPEDLNTANLNQFDAIVAGIRLYNTKPEMAFTHDALMKYVENGGTYVVQYTTSYGLVTDEIGPYPFQISRNRVTKEEAAVTLLEQKHPILNQPNAITQKDFEGWNQERGLYFADEWDEKYTPILSWNDPGEDPQKGSLLVADYGKGSFVFTGISFFRHLPYGVPGSYRLFLNILSYKPNK